MAVKRILAPVDFSPDSLHALAYARDLATRWRAELVLLHVVDQSYLAGAPVLAVANPRFAEILQDQWRLANQDTVRLAARTKKQWPRSRALVKRGTPSQTIVDTARRLGVDLIVMSTHGRSGLAHALIGSVTERVVRHAHCAVLTVRRGSGGRRASSRR